jgi:hypothetical protein
MEIDKASLDIGSSKGIAINLSSDQMSRSRRCAFCQQFNLEEIFDWPNYRKEKHEADDCRHTAYSYPDLEYPRQPPFDVSNHIRRGLGGLLAEKDCPLCGLIRDSISNQTDGGLDSLPSASVKSLRVEATASNL